MNLRILFVPKYLFYYHATNNESRACNTRYAADGDVVDDTFTSIDDGDGSSKVQNSLKVSGHVKDFLFPILTADYLEIWNNRVTCYRWTC